MTPKEAIDKTLTDLLRRALGGSERAFSRYTAIGHGTGACVLTKRLQYYESGPVSLKGGASIHPELGALYKAILTDPLDPIIAVAIVSTQYPIEFTRPCGSCLQAFQDYQDNLRSQGIDVAPLYFACGKPDLTYDVRTLSQLLPFP